MAEILRQTALEEAASRSKTRSPLNTTTSSRATTEAEGEAEELLAVFEDEKARNDALARSVDQRLEVLANAKKSNADEAKTDEKHRLELEWQQLEYAIRALEKENSQAPPLDSPAVTNIRTRAELQDLTVQQTSAIDFLRTELSSEKDALLREQQLESDLNIVSAGLVKRFAQLQRKRQQDLTSESAIRELNRKFKQEERRFKELLAQLIDLGSSLFPPASNSSSSTAGRKVVTLRHYLDEFMNQAWDQPLDPYVSASRLAQRRTGGEVDDAMIELLIRANFQAVS
uniref:Uncharacterized protein n=1 Tax=Melanopsichium pennsylvanicum 4 TaxID=1398559 RepID=A0A077RBW2_9BASI|nr:hypothetical protein BN887_02381 [Melanopsichium pennsylvanicum 4]